MDDHCVECRLYGSNYSYDEDGDIVSNCYDCPFEPYARGEEDDDTISRRAAIDAFAPYAEYESNRTNAEWVRRINMVLSTLPSAQQIPWDANTRNSMVFTLRTVANHGDMDAIDEDNIKRLSRWLEGGEQ